MHLQTGELYNIDQLVKIQQDLWGSPSYSKHPLLADWYSNQSKLLLDPNRNPYLSPGSIVS